jgi:hypothetical protein
MADITEFHLTFGNSLVGIKLHALASPSVRPVEEPRTVHAFRHKQILIDHRYPALLYEHPFIVYTEGNSIAGYVYDFYRLNWLWDIDNPGPTSPRTLLVTNSSGSPIISFGACWFADLELKEPSDLLIHSAALVGVKFHGSTRPQLL